MTKTGATRTLDNARDRLEIDLPVHPLELSDGIAWEHRHMSERRDLRLDMAGKDTTPLIWKFGYDDASRIPVGNDDFDTLASLELDPDRVVTAQWEDRGEERGNGGMIGCQVYIVPFGKEEGEFRIMACVDWR